MTERGAVDLLGLPLRWPIIGAPMAGGPSTPELVAAVGDAGGLGMLAAGYRAGDALAHDIAEVRGRTRAPFGVNVFVPQDPVVDEAAVAAYLATLEPEAEDFGVDVVASWDDDGWDDKLRRLTDDPVPVVSFTFGCPDRSVITRLRQAGSRVVVTVTDPDEARTAAGAGADAVAAQGIEAGGHQGTFRDDLPLTDGWDVLSLVGAVRAAVEVPVIAAGGLMSGSEVAGAIGAGAAAVQVGTALLRSPECGASEMYKAALVDPAFAATAMTRSFSGRRARGLVNGFMRAHPGAPSAYPQINNATRALRREAARRGDPDAVNLWAGTGHRRAEERPAGDIIASIGQAAAEAGGALPGPA
jgi:nitronate monooxygenase